MGKQERKQHSNPRDTEHAKAVKQARKRVQRAADEALARIDALAAAASTEMTEQTVALEQLVLRTREVTDDLVARTRAAAEQAERQQQVFEEALVTVDTSVAELRSQLRQRVDAVDRHHDAALAHLDSQCQAATERLVAVDEVATRLDRDGEELLQRQREQLDMGIDDAAERHRKLVDAAATRVEQASDHATERLERETELLLDRLRQRADEALTTFDEIGAALPAPDAPEASDPEGSHAADVPEALLVDVAAPWEAPWETPEEAPRDDASVDAPAVELAVFADHVTPLPEGSPWSWPPVDETAASDEAPTTDATATVDETSFHAPTFDPDVFPTSATEPTTAPRAPSIDWTEPPTAAPPVTAPFAPSAMTGPSATNSIMFRAATADLLASLTHLGRTAADGWLHAQLVHAGVQGQPATFLRLTIYDLSGWWEHHDIVGTASAFSRQSAVFGLAELVQAIRHDSRANRNDTATLAFAGDITVGTTLVPRQHVTMPLLEGDRHKIERIDLGRPDHDGLVVQSQAGRLVVPSRLASLLRSRRATDADLITVGDTPCICAQVAGPADDVTATITAPLSGDGTGTADDRRVPSENPVAQLLGALSPASSAEDVTAILSGGVSYARRRAAAHPALPPELIAEVLRDGTEAMRGAAASNPSLPVSSIAAACTDPAPSVRMAVAAHPDIPPATILQLARDDDRQVRRRVVANPSLPLEMLTLLADDADPSVRAAVAAHAACPVETLVTLTHDAHPSVCAAVADNPGCPVELLDELVGVVPEVVLSNPRTPEHLLVAGSQVRAGQLRAAVAANPATPARQLQALARDPDPMVVAALADNETAPSNARRRARRRASGRKGAFADEVSTTT